jgi:hypothetical protein
MTNVRPPRNWHGYRPNSAGLGNTFCSILRAFEYGVLSLHELVDVSRLAGAHNDGLTKATVVCPTWRVLVSSQYRARLELRVVVEGAELVLVDLAGPIQVDFIGVFAEHSQLLLGAQPTVLVATTAAALGAHEGLALQHLGLLSLLLCFVALLLFLPLLGQPGSFLGLSAASLSFFACVPCA